MLLLWSSVHVHLFRKQFFKLHNHKVQEGLWGKRVNSVGEINKASLLTSRTELRYNLVYVLYTCVNVCLFSLNVCLSVQVRLNQVMKQQERLLRESEATVARRENVALRMEAMVHSSHKQTTKGELNRFIQGLQRKIPDTHKVADMDFPLLCIYLKHSYLICSMHVISIWQSVRRWSGS